VHGVGNTPRKHGRAKIDFDKEPAMRRTLWIAITFAFSICLTSAGYANDSGLLESTLFEKDGFRIRSVGTGGNLIGSSWIVIDGNIPPEAGELFSRYVGSGEGLDVSLNSKGGSLAGGIRLGRAIRSAGMNTVIGSVCHSACAYAFLGGVHRQASDGEYGVHQFYTDALIKDPNGKVFSPTDFSNQQTLTGLLMSYVIEMGVSADLVAEANKALPSQMNMLSKKQLEQFRVVFDPKSYSNWKLEPYRNGLIAYSQTQDQKNKMTIFCTASRRAKLLVTYYDPVDGGRKDFKSGFGYVDEFSLLDRKISRADTRLEEHSRGLDLHVPLTAKELDILESNKNPHGRFWVQVEDVNVYVHRRNVLGFNERISLNGLSASVRLVRRNCIN
jgi:hypothetical protein